MQNLSPLQAVGVPPRQCWEPHTAALPDPPVNLIGHGPKRKVYEAVSAPEASGPISSTRSRLLEKTNSFWSMLRYCGSL